MFQKFATKHLPMPRALREAVAANQVALGYAKDGSIAYVVRPGCPNRTAVLDAISKRSRWELWAAGAEGVALVVVLCGAVALALK